MRLEDLFGLLIPVTYLAMLGIESRFQARDFPPLRLWRLRGAFFVMVLLGINAALPSWLPQRWLGAHRLLDGTRLGVLGGAILGYLTVSFAQYWFHRAQHRLSPLWRVTHQLHHSPLRMDISGAAYTSPLEVVMSVLIFTGMTTFVLGLDPLSIAICGYIGAFYSMFQHLNVRTPRWLGYFIERPEAHCVHHARDVHRFNYSDLPLWDLVFGTFCSPATFDDDVGFAPAASRRVTAMLLGVDVNAEEALVRGVRPAPQQVAA